MLPLFPLPNVVLFPGVLLPLHIFEPRYRTMVADALADDRRIGMVLLQPGYESTYDERPPVFAVGCSGAITHADRLEGGRYNIVLHGIERFRIVAEDHDRAYRRASVALLTDRAPDDEDRSEVRQLRLKLETLLVELGHRRGVTPSDAVPASSISDLDVVHTLAQYLDLEPLEKQALLECDGLRSRAQSLVELLEMKRLLARLPGTPNIAH